MHAHCTSSKLDDLHNMKLKSRKSFLFQNNKVDPRSHILSNVTNVVCKICFGEEFELDDPKFVRLLQLYRDFDKALGITQVADFWPILKYFPVISKAFKVSSQTISINNVVLIVVIYCIRKVGRVSRK